MDENILFVLILAQFDPYNVNHLRSALKAFKTFWINFELHVFRSTWKTWRKHYTKQEYITNGGIIFYEERGTIYL